jgi:SAM-dependent methyltransferase
MKELSAPAQSRQQEGVRKSHWETIFSTKGPEQVSWYAPHLNSSLRMIEQTGINKAGWIIDVGGGASTLVDDLLEEGYRNLSVLDLSSAALAASQARLGGRAKGVNWIEADITTAELPREHFDIWHDRAVFHFFTAAVDRRQYVQRTIRSLKSGGHLIIATFAPDGPPRCSGLEVIRYGIDTLHREFGEAFELVECTGEKHTTPFNTEQQFSYFWFKKL